ncbi:short-chain dehydrogenases/reductase [Aspergillus aculeatinus CBS 121060]|uniref:Short-chain dehydrogenases/reductase n=1 Tax=Aspergillus aculeatinus CBS 121060 TaxID=1448322 RepID=A0ACD1HE67_9EURO|nr:short-chain dehydrogenases/reductase [Aspergillus aculeatinus CBS 121060]RAH71892.1 short-chain dehydrogenases/reductase [Aspergillus aculeatinus CBS 121060]
MPTLNEVRQSNATLSTSRPELIAVFVGGTSGIGEATAKQLAQSVNQPTIHVVGRSAASGSRVLEELRAANPDGKFHFIQADLSLLRNVDTACEQIKEKEKSIDLLFLSTGHLAMSKNETEEGLDDNHVLRYYGRMRFIHNLLPLLENSTGAPRVVSVLAAGQEGHVDEHNLDLRQTWSFRKAATYAATLNSLALEHLAAAHPTVGFAHVFPGIVRTPLMQSTFGNWAGAVLGVLSRPLSMTPEESGQRNLFIATSAAYPAAKPRDASGYVGTPLAAGLRTAVASTGQVGAGSYILNYDGKNATKEKLMAEYRERGFAGKVWEHTVETFRRVLQRD